MENVQIKTIDDKCYLIYMKILEISGDCNCTVAVIVVLCHWSKDKVLFEDTGCWIRGKTICQSKVCYLRGHIYNTPVIFLLQFLLQSILEQTRWPHWLDQTLTSPSWRRDSVHGISWNRRSTSRPYRWVNPFIYTCIPTCRLKARSGVCHLPFHLSE